jgi:ubiquinone/menaquinone biosynthesis C-methylase UbiE
MPTFWKLVKFILPSRQLRLRVQDNIGPIFFGKKFLIPTKQKAELIFWEQHFLAHGGEPETEYYRKFMMDMGGIEEESFFSDKICLDVGCGPRGSLTWLKNARAAIGIDPLADQYMRLGIGSHKMIYLSASAERLPLPSHYVDVVFSMNSLDHVDNLAEVCSEIRRVLKPGGYFIGSLNLDEAKTLAEPYPLTEELLQNHLFCGWEREFYKIRPKPKDEKGNVTYRYFYEDCPDKILNASGPRALWCRFRAN